MYFQSCFHPKVIKNSATGDTVVVRCGKCVACTNARANLWVQRLDLEAQAHKYTYFFTLTYDEFNVPQMLRLRYEHSHVPAYINSDTGLVASTENIPLSSKDREYIKNTKVLNYLDKMDFQKFIKRLRYYFTQINEKAQLRYYLCGEYGPRTYRPHGHCLLFFDDDECASKIEELLSKAWPFGVVYDPHSVEGSASKYVASYVNCISNLPAIYSHQALKPFVLFSKSPAIGTTCREFKDLRKIFVDRDSEVTVFSASSKKFVSLPLWRSLQDRLFPRCQRFDALSASRRVALYRLYYDHPKWSAVKAARYLKRWFVDTNEDWWMPRYFKTIAYKYKNGLTFRKQLDSFEDGWKFKDYPFLPSQPVAVPFSAERSEIKEFCMNSLQAFWRCISRACRNAKDFGMSIENYLSNLTFYYEEKEKEQLRKYFEFQDSFFKTYPVKDYVYLDLSFFKKIKSVSYDVLSVPTRNILKYLGIVSSDIEHLNWRLHPAFVNFETLNKKVFFDNIKQKENNDYALQKRDEFGNVLTYQNL